MTPYDPTPPQPHSAEYFGDQRDHWWNADYLALIARRTGKPISYFMAGSTVEPEQNMDLATDLTRVAGRVRRHAVAARLSKSEAEAMKLVELTLHQAAELVKALPFVPTSLDEASS